MKDCEVLEVPEQKSGSQPNDQIENLHDDEVNCDISQNDEYCGETLDNTIM
jgi:hypothetical protein